MMSNEFEKALDAFLEGAEADEAHQALYDIRSWLANATRRMFASENSSIQYESLIKIKTIRLIVSMKFGAR